MGMDPCRDLGNHKDGKMFGVTLRRRSGRRRQRAARTKVQKLQKIVPGGHSLEPDSLLVQTANYILHLRLQIHVLESILELQERSMTSL